jgi:hypothetical protein
MTVRVYRSSDAGAPTLSGTTGSLLALLDSVLISGYGSSTGSGWTKPYSATNIAVYRTAGGNQRYLRLDDSNATPARFHGYETMSSDSVGVNNFSQDLGTSFSQAAGYPIMKSSTADATARAWVIITSATAMYMFIEPTSTPTTWEASTNTTNSSNGQFFFGDFISYRPGDTYNTAIFGPVNTTAGTGQFGSCSNSISSSAASGHYICRGYLGQGQGGVKFHKGLPGQYASVTTMGASSSSNTYPDPLTGGILLTSVELAEIVASSYHVVRGRMPGMWAPISSLAGSHGDIITGTGVVAGKTLLCVVVYTGSTAGRCFIEISDTW